MPTVYSVGLIFVSARTNKRHHHHYRETSDSKVQRLNAKGSLRTLYMLGIWVLALLYDASSACQHAMSHIGPTACVCSYGPQSPLYVRHMGLGPYLGCFQPVSTLWHHHIIILILAAWPVYALHMGPQAKSFHARHMGLGPSL
jgi:hypothetical protein